MCPATQLLRTALTAAVIVCCASGAQTRPTTAPTTSTIPAAVPSEKQRPIFELMNVEAAWETTRGSPDCLVGIIDTGFDFFHPALRGAVQPGYVADDVFHSPAFPVIAHGTGMASLIVAQRVDDEGMIGFGPGCRVIAAQQGMPEHTLARMQQRFMREHPTATMEDIQQEMMRHQEEVQAFGKSWIGFVARTTSQAIRDLTDRKVKVISISAFFPRQTLAVVPGAAEEMDAAFAYAIEHDVVIVIGAGNSATRVEEYPGDAETVLIAGASTLADERWVLEVDFGGQKIAQGSCTGPRLSVLAPVENLVIARPHEEAFYKLDDSPMGPSEVPFEGPYAVEPSGATSSATAIVASLAALVRSARPDLDARAVIRIVKESARDLGEPGFDEDTGFGRIDFAAALELAASVPHAD